MYHDYRQFDLRTPEAYSASSPRCILVNLNSYIGVNAEAKCLSINPVRPELLAVGCSDPYVRLYDRRMLSVRQMLPNYDDTNPMLEYKLLSDCATYYTAG